MTCAVTITGGTSLGLGLPMDAGGKNQFQLHRRTDVNADTRAQAPQPRKHTHCVSQEQPRGGRSVKCKHHQSGGGVQCCGSAVELLVTVAFTAAQICCYWAANVSYLPPHSLKIHCNSGDHIIIHRRQINSIKISKNALKCCFIQPYLLLI